MRPEPPECVAEYRRKSKTPPIPKCCHTCDHYDAGGVCAEYGEAPPEGFAATVDSCHEWLEEVPF